MTDKKREDSDRQKNVPDVAQPSAPTRRKMLKNLAVGSTVIGGVVTGPKWVKPVVDLVAVPAHAQTSPEPTTTEAPPSGSKTFTSNGRFTIPDRVTQIDVKVYGGGGGGGGYGKSKPGKPKSANTVNGPTCLGTPDDIVDNYLGGTGEQVTGSFTVTSGNSYPVTIGYGGYGDDMENYKQNTGGNGYNEGSPGSANFVGSKEPYCLHYIHGGGGGSSHFNGLEASGGGGGYGRKVKKSKKGIYGQGGGPYGGYGVEHPENDGGIGSGKGKGATGGGFGENGANGSVVISY